jgi:hypothetical protein
MRQEILTGRGQGTKLKLNNSWDDADAGKYFPPRHSLLKGTVPFLRNRRSYFINHNGCTKQDRI